MKLPEKIKGRNRIRDAAIVAAFKIENLSYPEISAKFKLTERRILQILTVNHTFLKRDKEWEKEKRINRLTQRLKTVRPTSRDELDIMAELRKEIEGDDEKMGRGNGDTRIFIIRPGDVKDATVRESILQQ